MLLVLETVIGMAAEVVPRAVTGKTRLAGEKLSVGRGGIMVATRGMLCGDW